MRTRTLDVLIENWQLGLPLSDRKPLAIIPNTNDVDTLSFTIKNKQPTPQTHLIYSLVSTYGRKFKHSVGLSNSITTGTELNLQFDITTELFPFGNTKYECFIETLDTITNQVDRTGVIYIKTEKGPLTGPISTEENIIVSQSILRKLITDIAGQNKPQPHISTIDHTFSVNNNNIILDTPIDLTTEKEISLRVSYTIPGLATNQDKYLLFIIGQGNHQEEYFPISEGVSITLIPHIDNIKKIAGFNIYFTLEETAYQYETVSAPRSVSEIITREIR